MTKSQRTDLIGVIAAITALLLGAILKPEDIKSVWGLIILLLGAMYGYGFVVNDK